MIGHMKKILVLLFCLAMSCAAAERLRIGLVLGGGGARGLAHVGVLKVLEEARVPVDCIVGTSMGALVAGSYAAGRTAQELAARTQSADWDDLLNPNLPRQFNTYRRKQDEANGLTRYDLGIADSGQVKVPRAALSTQKIAYFLREMTFSQSTDNFDHLTIPYRAVATDLETGDMVVLAKGGLVEAMRASMAVPGLFQPVEIEGRILVDGGLSRNLPVDVARQLCADVVIAVDVGDPLVGREKLRNALDIAVQYTRLMMKQNVAPQHASLTDKDLLIAPDLTGFSSADFNRGVPMMALGEAAARQNLGRLQALALDEAAWRQWQSQRLARRAPVRPVVDVDVEALAWVNPDVLKEAADIPLGQPLDINLMQQRLNRIYGRGDFSQLDYVLADVAGGQAVTLKPVEKDWGPNYLSAGLALAGDEDRAQVFELALMYRRSWVNRLGAEWKTTAVVGRKLGLASEFFQPLHLDGYGFISPWFALERQPLALSDGGETIAEYNFRRRQAGLDLGTSQLRYGELRLGFLVSDYRAFRQIGQPLLPNLSARDAGFRAELFYDQLDNLYFPRRGAASTLQIFNSTSGKEGQYRRYFGQWRKAVAFGTQAAGNLTLGGQVLDGGEDSLANLGWLGGPFRLSSYRYQELLGTQQEFARLQFYRTLGASLAGSGNHHAGLSLEGGRVRGVVSDKSWHQSAALFWGYESVLGPLYLGAAYGDNKQLRLFFSLGSNRF